MFSDLVVTVLSATAFHCFSEITGTSTIAIGTTCEKLVTGIKLTFSFKDVQGEPMFIKMFRFRTTAQLDRNTFEKMRSNLEFKDLKVVWN